MLDLIIQLIDVVRVVSRAVIRKVSPLPTLRIGINLTGSFEILREIDEIWDYTTPYRVGERTNIPDIVHISLGKSIGKRLEYLGRRHSLEVWVAGPQFIVWAIRDNLSDAIHRTTFKSMNLRLPDRPINEYPPPSYRWSIVAIVIISFILGNILSFL